MSPATKPRDPEKRMGVYKSLEEVPERRRFRQYAAEYGDRDVWREYLQEEDYESKWASSTKKRYERIEESWKKYMANRSRHHALATTNDVEEWSRALLEKVSVDTARWKWGQVQGFYEWLQWHTEHPHVYNPFLMAASKDGPSAVIWEAKMDRRKGSNE